MKKGLFEELKKYGKSDFYPFHMPGHKRNPASGPLSEMYKYDITEIDGFDNLHQAEGIIKEAQEHAAFLYHSEETYFLINGSTAGILSAVSAVAGRGRKLIVARNCHKAVYHAAFLNQLEMEYIYPAVIEEFGVSGGISCCQVEDKIREIADREGITTDQIRFLVAGIVLTSPTYDGILSDVKEIVKTAHHYGIPVIVDQAHGAHFGFHPAFPESAVAEGADFVIHSVHKTLPAPTQTALLHHNGFLVDSELIKKYLRIYQSSSPSYLLMAGIDSCMELVEREGSKKLDMLLSFRKELINKAGRLKYIRIYPSMAEVSGSGEDVGRSFESGIEEPGRLLISVRGTSLTGQKFYDILRENYRLQLEMCGADYVIAILSMMDKREGFERLSNALTEIDKMLILNEEIRQTEDDNRISLAYQQYQPQSIVKICDAFVAEYDYILLEEANERIVADFINLYPPGIPILVPGEKVDDRIIQMIEVYLSGGYTVQGIETDQKNKKYYLKVLRERTR